LGLRGRAAGDRAQLRIRRPAERGNEPFVDLRDAENAPPQFHDARLRLLAAGSLSNRRRRGQAPPLARSGLTIALMLPHRIRLRGPWQVESSRTIRLPDEWHALGAEPACLIRSFGWPNPLAAHERVWLLLDGLTAPCEARLNGAPLGTLRPPVECDITP